MKKQKFDELSILTDNVYLNIYHKNGLVETKMENTTIAISEYGELEVRKVGEPEYSKDGDDKVDKNGRKQGVTNIALDAED